MATLYIAGAIVLAFFAGLALGMFLGRLDGTRIYINK